MPQAVITDRSPHSPPYKRHRPEQTLLYQIIERFYPVFCPKCGGDAKVIACIEDQVVVDKVLQH